MFKKMQQQKDQSSSITSSVSTSSTNAIPNENKCIKSETIEKTKRKPKILKVGIIEKTKKSTTKTGRRHDDDSSGREDSAWSRYMNEVRAYKEKYGDDEDKNPHVGTAAVVENGNDCGCTLPLGLTTTVAAEDRYNCCCA
ncbi:hypothetical protein DERF_010435 [Dermatophagoides farinae]|uniref:Uncharacterized protein n=1 Tax=Dermatophagoides farinae TaxID=6954 RepID=A0A922L216_DERFA|nr:hypothetical protein DERF_010435 [Dermatophagoides farinae]